VFVDNHEIGFSVIPMVIFLTPLASNTERLHKAISLKDLKDTISRLILVLEILVRLANTLMCYSRFLTHLC